MTAFALDFRPARLVIAADTLGYIPSREEIRPLGYLTKVFPIPHLKAVIFGRGQMQIPAMAALAISLDPTIGTLEDAATRLPEILLDVTARYADSQGIDDPDSLNLAEVVLAGWSDTERRCRIWHSQNCEGYELQDDGGEHYGILSMPILPGEYMPKPNGSVDKQLVAMMRAEQRFFDDHPELMFGMRLGGEIQRWQVDRDGVSQTVIHRFADYEATKHAGAAVAARILRGDEVVSVADGLVPVAEAKRPDEVSVPSASRAERRRAEREMSRTERKAARRARAA